MTSSLLPPPVFATRPASHLSDRYGFIPTLDIVRSFEDHGWVVTKAQANRVRNPEREGLQKHVVRFTRAEDAIIAKGDERMEIAVFNGHDGTSSVRMAAGVFRLICLNGMVVSSSTVGDVRLGHHRLHMDTVIAAAFQIQEQSAKVRDVIDLWKTVNVSEDDAFHLAEQGAVLRWGADTSLHPLAPQALLEARRNADTGNTLWRVFNRVQENLIKGGQRTQGRLNPVTNKPFRATRGLRNLTLDLKVNEGLWQAASELALRA